MPPARDPLTPGGIVAVALRLVEEGGPDALSMRKLAAELGVAVTAIYWHVGNREALLDAVVEEAIAEMGAIEPVGSTPQARLESVASTLHDQLLAHSHVIELISDRGLTSRVFLGARAVLAAELAAASLDPESIALGVHAIQLHVVGSVVLERRAARLPAQLVDDGAWRSAVGSAGLDEAVVAALARPALRTEVFEFSTRALVTAVLQSPSMPTMASPMLAEPIEPRKGASP